MSHWIWNNIAPIPVEASAGAYEHKVSTSWSWWFLKSAWMSILNKFRRLNILKGTWSTSYKWVVGRLTIKRYLQTCQAVIVLSDYSIKYVITWLMQLDQIKMKNGTVGRWGRRATDSEYCRIDKQACAWHCRKLPCLNSPLDGPNKKYVLVMPNWVENLIFHFTPISKKSLG